jgi:murein DD-endopeptidase MepM/ murein hydrolase activator NlpD
MPLTPQTFARGGTSMVPDTFTPSVSQGETPLSPASSPWVSPMKNAAPGLLSQTGQTLTEAGDTETRVGDTIGDRVQATMDDAQTKAAENQFLQAALPALGQYRTTEGINATQQWDPTAQAISKAKQDARATLANPIQQRMFDQVANDHMLSFSQQMSDHRSVEEVQYGKQQANDRADSMNVLAMNAYLGGRQSDYQKYSGQADDETRAVAQLSGAQPDGAPDSDATQAMLRAKRGVLAQGVVAGLLDKHAYNEAADYFQNVQGNLDVPAAERLGNAIKSVTLQESAKTDGEKAVMAAKGITGPGVLQPPVAAATISTTDGINGIDLHTAQGTPVRAPASGTVSKVWNDEANGGGLTVQMQMPGGYTAEFNHLSAANYTDGQKITIGQVLGLSGKDDSGQGVVNYSMTDKDGQQIDPRQASSAPMDPKNFNAPADEEKAVDWINSNVADPDERKMAEGYVRGIASTNRQITNQEHAAALKQATDFWLQNGKSIANLPANIKMQLTPEDIDSFTQQATAAKNDPQTEIDFLSGKTPLTPDNVKAAYSQGKLSDDGYVKWSGEALKLQNDPQKTRQVSIDHDQLTDLFSVNQLPDMAYPKNDADRENRVEMETAIKNEIDNQQQKANRELSWQEKGKIARDMVIDKVYTSGWPNTNSGLMPVATLTPDEQNKATVWIGNQSVRMMDIPAPATERAMQDLRSSGLPATQANIAKWWLLGGKPKQ